MSYHLKMVRVAAEPIATFVVDLFLGRNHPEEIDPHADVSGDSASIEAHPSITTTTTCARSSTLPFPTPSILIDLHVGHDLVEDLLTSICQGIDVHGITP